MKVCSHKADLRHQYRFRKSLEERREEENGERGRVWKGRLPGEKRCVPPDSACKSGIPLSRTSHSAAVLGLPEAPSHGSNPGQSLGSSLYKSGGCRAEMD